MGIMIISSRKPLCLVQTKNSQPYFATIAEFIAYYDLPPEIPITVKECASDSKAEIEKILGKFTQAMRWVICGNDALLAALLTRVMFLEKLDQHEIAFFPAISSSIKPFYHSRSLLAEAISQPLIRDEKGSILLSSARLVPRTKDQNVFLGECYVDEHKIAGDAIREIQLEPLENAPGLRARMKRKLGWTCWQTGRAAQTGGEDFKAEIAVSGSMITQPSRPRVTFYRHHIDMLIVR